MKNKNKKGKKEINMSFTFLKNCGFHNLDVKSKEHMKPGGLQLQVSVYKQSPAYYVI